MTDNLQAFKWTKPLIWKNNNFKPHFRDKESEAKIRNELPKDRSLMGDMPERDHRYLIVNLGLPSSPLIQTNNPPLCLWKLYFRLTAHEISMYSVPSMELNKHYLCYH